MKALVILVHGYNVYDGGRHTVGKLRPFFAKAGIPYLMVNYVHSNPFSSRMKNDKIAQRVAAAAHAASFAGLEVIAVGHSNGCAILHRATTKYTANISKCVYINPALKNDMVPGSAVNALDVWHSPDDSPVKWSRFLPGSNARPWGDMGAAGYKGDDPRITNFDKQNNFPVSSSAHSDVFDIDKLAYFGDLIVSNT